jgi:hypothetical protein
LFSSLKELIAWMQNDDDDEDNSDWLTNKYLLLYPLLNRKKYL